MSYIQSSKRPNLWRFHHTQLSLERLWVASSIGTELLLVLLKQLADSLKEKLKEMMGVPSNKKYWNLNLNDLISIIPNPLDGITVLRNTRHITHKDK